MFSREIKSLRVLNGLTQKELAEKLAMGETSYTKRENGQISFTVEELNQLRIILNISDQDIIRIFFNNNVALKTTS